MVFRQPYKVIFWDLQILTGQEYCIKTVFMYQSSKTDLSPNQHAVSYLNHGQQTLYVVLSIIWQTTFNNTQYPYLLYNIYCSCFKKHSNRLSKYIKLSIVLYLLSCFKTPSNRLPRYFKLSIVLFCKEN